MIVSLSGAPEASEQEALGLHRAEVNRPAHKDTLVQDKRDTNSFI